ncbi:putative DCC family thiol-disulfide oxidoreductase YuxK [Streptacidiphilus sp. MAP12-33]|uniref:thiol-disulfide oxidoreductase DCC family protein n=1 Tax=Streptacidiphilus sp. MAP12-33 TaxID=3156266 RepID=UPI00351129F9
MDITPGTPLLVFDGDCAFCTSTVRFGERLLGTDGWAAVPFQFAEMDTLAEFTAGAVSRERAEREVLWITPTGTVYGGADAVAKVLLRQRRLPWNVLGAAMRLPGVHALAEAVYRLVSANRERLPGGTPACAIKR